MKSLQDIRDGGWNLKDVKLLQPVNLLVGWAVLNAAAGISDRRCMELMTSLRNMCNQMGTFLR
jgi:hypothetical protein